MTSSKAQQRGLRKREMEDAENDAEAMRLRAQRLEYREIAERMGCSISTAFVRAQRGLAAVPVEAADELRKIENMQLDELRRKLWDVLTAAHPLVSHGKLMKDDQGHVLLDDRPVIAAANTLLRLMERYARLNGLDAPQLHDVKVSEDDGLESEFRRLVAELGARAHGSPAPVAALEQGDGAQAAGVDGQ